MWRFDVRSLFNPRDWFRPKARFGQGRRRLDEGEISRALALKHGGASDSAVARSTGLNRRTVARLWQEANSLEHMVVNLAASQKGGGQVVGATPEGRKSSVTDLLALQLSMRLVDAALRDAKHQHQPWLHYQAQVAIHNLLGGSSDIADMAAWEHAQADPAFRRELAMVALARVQGAQATPASTPPPRPRKGGDAAVLSKVKKALRDHEEQQKRERVKWEGVLTSAAGPGGALTTMATALGALLIRSRQPATGGPSEVHGAGPGVDAAAPTLLEQGDTHA